MSQTEPAQRGAAEAAGQVRQQTTSQGTGPQDDASVGRFGPLLAGIWLVFLLHPLLEGWSRRDQAEGVLGMLTTLVFAAVYISPWVTARADRRRLVRRPALRWSLAYLGALVVLGALTVFFLGEPGLASVVYVGVACVMVLRLQAAGVMSRTVDRVGAHEENARLAVDNERTRFARDLHDILGHSLTVITVKAELAQKLLDVDVRRARAEIADLERLSRDALFDVRRAVEGYRDITLPGELVRARAALTAAEIEADLPSSTEQVPSDLRELFAWTIREGVTNVIRHSGAKRCEVLLTATSAEVRDDGLATPSPNGHGSGLAGLRERAADVDATVITRELSPGFSLTVVRQ